MTVARYFFYLIFLTFPFYIFPSGGAQLSTACVLAMVVMLVVSGPSNIVLTKPIIRHAMFAIYSIFVNIAWYLTTSDPNFINHILFGGFAALTFFGCAALSRHFDWKDAKILVFVIFVTVAIQLAIISLGIGREGFRTIAFFNNPNQLAYFATLCAGAALIVAHLYRLNTLFVPAIVLMALPLALASQSRAGIVACVLYVLLMVVYNRSLSLVKRVLLIVVLAAGLAYGFDQFTQSENYENIAKRMDSQSIERESDSMRGYGRIFDYPDHIVWGSGEGGYERFDEEIELHSYPATLLFCYGIIGVLLFVRFLFAAIPDLRTWVYLGPILIYNLTHHGGRSLILWGLLGLIAACAARATQSTPRRRRSRRSSSRRRPAEGRVAHHG